MPEITLKPSPYRAYLKWRELTETQQAQVKKKLKSVIQTSGEDYLKQPGMIYTFDDKGNHTGGYQDPYLLKGFFSI
jgi:hypothetical protein